MPPGHSVSPPPRSPESGQVVRPLGPHNGVGVGEAVLGSQVPVPPWLGETKQNPNRFLTLPCPSPQTKNPNWRKVIFFSLSKKGLLKETTDCKLPSLLLLSLFLDGYKDSVRPHT